MSSRSTTPSQDRLARRERNASLLSVFASNPDTPLLLGGIARLEAWRQRPRSLEHRLAVKADSRLTRIHETDRILKERAASKLAKVLAEYRKQQALQQWDATATPEPTVASIEISQTTLPPPAGQPRSVQHIPRSELPPHQPLAQSE